MNKNKCTVPFRLSKLSKTIALLTLGSSISTIAQAEAYFGHVDLAGYHFFERDSAGPTGLIDVFVPLAQSPNQLFYANLRGIDPSGSTFEGNLGLGYRWLSYNEDHLAGAYAFFDQQKSELGNMFNHATIGGEYWYRSFFAGANVYIPVGTTEHPESIFNTTELRDAEDNSGLRNIYYSQGFEKSLTGVDAEIGYEFLRGLTVYAGAYSFMASGVDDVVGPKARVIYEWSNIEEGKKVLALFDGISLESEVRHDKLRETDWYAGVRFRIGFGKTPKLTGTARHMIDRVRRDISLVTQGRNGDFERLNKENGSAITVYDARNSAELREGVQNEQADIVAVWGDIAIEDTLHVADGLTILGNDYSFTVDDQDFTAQIVEGAPGSITAASGIDLFQVNGSASFQDLTLQGSNFTAITNQGVENYNGHVIIDNLESQGGIDLSAAGSNSSVTFSMENSTINMTGETINAPTIRLTASDNGTLNIDSLTNNTIIMNGNMDTNNNAAITIQATNALLNINDINDNNINVTNQDGHAIGISIDTIQSESYFNQALNQNTITVNGTDSAVGIAFHSDNNSTTTKNDSFNNNIINTYGTTETIGIEIITSDNSELTSFNSVNNNQGDNSTGILLRSQESTMSLSGSLQGNNNMGEVGLSLNAEQGNGNAGTIDITIDGPSLSQVNTSNGGDAIVQCNTIRDSTITVNGKLVNAFCE